MEKPILFNTEMVKAILDSRKTQTRRIIKPQPKNIIQGCPYSSTGFAGVNENGECMCSSEEHKPPYKVGDILWVRETWKCIQYNNMDGDLPYGVEFKADGKRIFTKFDDNERYEKFNKFVDKEHWQPSLFMPKEAARIFLKVTNVRVERLQEITEEGAKAEGIRNYTKDGEVIKYAVSDDWWTEYHSKNKKHFRGTAWQDMPRTAKEAFNYLWDSCYNWPKCWSANPWIWVIEFERVEKGKSNV